MYFPTEHEVLQEKLKHSFSLYILKSSAAPN